MRKIALSGIAALAVVLGIPAVSSAAIRAASPAASPAAAVAAAKPQHALLSVSCLSAKNCVAVGTDGVSGHLLTETWNGVKWTASEPRLPKGAVLGLLASVSCPAPGKCVAVGETAVNPASLATYTGLAESWNGKSWSQIKVPLPAGSHGSVFSAISCVSAAACAATGDYYLANGDSQGFTEVLSRGKWTLYKPPGFSGSSDNAVLEDLSCMSAVSCVAVGSSGTRTSPGGTPASVVAAEFWNGKNWSLTRLPMPAGSAGAWLYDVSCVPSKTCVATGGRSVGTTKSAAFAEIWTAGKWKAATPYATGGDPSLFTVSCVSATNCVAGGGGDVPTARNNAFSDSWNGKSWKYVKLPTPSGGGGTNASMVTGVSCLTASDCVAVGTAGPVKLLPFAYGFAAIWNGKTWRAAAAP